MIIKTIFEKLPPEDLGKLTPDEIFNRPPRLILQAEKWTEWIHLKVSGDLERRGWWHHVGPVRFWFSQWGYDAQKDVFDYWATPLIPFIIIYSIIHSIWWTVARYCYDAGWLKQIDPAVKVSWFWPQYFFRAQPKQKPLDIEQLSKDLGIPIRRKDEQD